MCVYFLLFIEYQVTEPCIDIVLNEPVTRPNLVRWSIVTCLFCFWPAGIYGICFAVDVC